MTVDFAAIREAIADALSTIDGLQAFPYLLANPSPPCAQVTRGPILFDQALQGGVHQPTFTIVVFVALTTDQGSQMLLDQYLAPTGAKSVKAAVEADTTLGGLVSAIHVTTATGETAYNRAEGNPVLASEFTAEVWT